MRPILFEIPGLGIPIFAYGFMIMVGFLVGIFIATRRARKAGMARCGIMAPMIVSSMRHNVRQSTSNAASH